MTDSPINLDEAHSIIAEGKARHAKYPGIDRLEYYIEYRYLESIVSELEAARQRIADLEDMRLYDPITHEVTFRNVIVPHAGDANAFAFILSGEWNPKTCGCEQCKEAEDVIRRYLAAIEGGKR